MGDDSRTRRAIAALSGALVGLVYGGLIAALAAAMSGAGHGWCSPGITTLAVVLAPAFGVALALRGRARQVLLIPVAALLLRADWLLVGDSWSEGFSYFNRAWAGAPAVVLLWAALWFGGQLAVARTLWSDLRAAADRRPLR